MKELFAKPVTVPYNDGCQQFTTLTTDPRTTDGISGMPDLVLIAEAVEHSSYTPQHISLLLRQGRVKGRKVGGTWLVDLDDLKRYEQEMNEL